MRKNLVLVAFLLVALVVFTIPLAVQSAAVTNEAIQAVRPALAIKAPQVAGVGEKVQIKVVELPGGAPVGGAGVWAVDIKNGSSLPTTSSSELDKLGTFLGWTDTTGILVYIFQDISRYLLIACQDGYTPGFAWITIQPLKEMAIKGPEVALVGQTCEFKVYETNGGAAVAGAGVWAMLMQNETAITDVSQDTLSYITTNGTFLGWTNNLGQVFHAFGKSGRYLLMATKQLYKPAFSKIDIKDVKELAIRAPETVKVLEPVTIRVVEKSVMPVEIPVLGAGVWAVTFVNTLDSLTNYDAVKANGIFLGWTDKEGYVSPKPFFTDPGQYWLVAFKDGYAPAVGKITVEPLKEMAIKGPDTALVGQTCEFTVYEPNGGALVAGAGVWAMLMQDETAFTNATDDTVMLVTKKGIFLGWTNNFGQVFHAFDKSGRYFLVAAKQGYKPAFGKITIKDVKELAIRAPATVKVLEPVTIRVVEKSILTVEIPVAGAGVWAISLDKAAKLDNISDYAAFVKTSGIFLGWTNQQGYVSPPPRFSNAGQYWLVAIKDGYAPGLSQITVTPLVKATAVAKPLTANPVSTTTKNK